jgi:hypothetical protein
MGRGVKGEGPLLTFFLGFAFFGFVSSSAISDAASSLASCAGSANSYFGCFGLTRSSTLPMHAHALYSGAGVGHSAVHRVDPIELAHAIDQCLLDIGRVGPVGLWSGSGEVWCGRGSWA